MEVKFLLSLVNLNYCLPLIILGENVNCFFAWNVRSRMSIYEIVIILALERLPRKLILIVIWVSVLNILKLVESISTLLFRIVESLHMLHLDLLQLIKELLLLLDLICFMFQHLLLFSMNFCNLVIYKFLFRSS